MEFLHSFLVFRLNFVAGKPVVSSWNGCFLKAGFHQRQSRCRSRKSAYDPVKFKHRSRKRSLNKRDGIGVRRIRTFPFFATPFTTPSLEFRLWSSENQIVGSRSGKLTNHNARSHALWLVCFFRFFFRLRQSGFHLTISCTLLITTPTPTPSLVKTSL